MKKANVNFSDEELIEMLAKGNISNLAIQSLYTRHYAVLSNYIKLNQGSEQDAQDVFQEVIVNFIEIVRNKKFRAESSIGTFLYTLNKYKWLNELKKRNRALAREEIYDSEIDKEAGDVSRLLMDKEAGNLVTDIMNKLGEICRKILTSYYYDNLTMKEILPLVNYDNEQVLRNKKYKCLKSLTQLLSADPGLAQRLKSALTYER